MKVSRQLTWCLVLIAANNLAGLMLMLWVAQNLNQARELAETLRAVQFSLLAAQGTGSSIPSDASISLDPSLSMVTAIPVGWDRAADAPARVHLPFRAHEARPRSQPSINGDAP
jgi:hypothetical protein